MSLSKLAVCEYSDSEEEFVQPCPLPARRSARIQRRDSPWAQWSSEKISDTFEAAGIPISQGLSREDLLLLAQNTLGSPPSTPDIAQTTSTSSGQTNPAGRKRTAKSASPRPAKKATLPARTPEPEDVNSKLIQVVQSLSETVKGLESKVTNIEHFFVNPNTSVSPFTISSALPTIFPTRTGSSDPQCVASTSSSLPTPRHTIQMPFQGVSAQTSNFSLSTAVPANEFGRRFVPPAAGTVSPQLRSNIIQGKDINLASLLLPSPAADRKMVDCGDVAVFLKTSDPRLQRNLSFAEFVIAFGIFRDTLCQVFPDRREELDLYLSMLA
ncbi:MAG: hypothetical protein ACRDCK_03210, partial [Plesiomonas shigelloides]